MKNDKNESNPNQCDQCDFVSKNKRGLSVHKRAKHEKVEKVLYNCDECGFNTRSRSGLKIHKRAKHKEKQLILGQNKIKFKSAIKQNNIVEPSLPEVSEYETETENSINFLERNRNAIKNREHLVVVEAEEARGDAVGHWSLSGDWSLGLK